MPTETLFYTGLYTQITTNKVTGVNVRTSFQKPRMDVERVWPAGRAKPKLSWIPPTSASWREDRIEACHGSWIYEDATNRYTRSGYFDSTIIGGTGMSFGGSTFPITHSSLRMRTLAQIEAQALTDCLNRVQQGKVNLAQAFAERRQTANLVSGTARRLAAGINALRKGNVAGALRALGSPSNRNRLSTRDIADQWLEIQYGWKPLLSDVYASVDRLRKKDEDISRYIMTAKRMVTEKSSRTDITTYSDSRRSQTSSYDRSYFVRLDYRVKHQVVASMSSMGVLDPLTLAWEILPWSFVVDWFLPIGNYLTAHSATQGLVFLGGSKTLRDYIVTDATWSAAGTRTKSLHASARSVEKSISRSVYVSSPTPKFPLVRDPFSTAHVLNALALLRGSFRR